MLGPQRAIRVEDALAGGPGILALPRPPHPLEDDRLLRFRQLARARVELDPVPVEGDVAARHNDARQAAAHGEGHESGGRNAAQVEERQALIRDGPRDRSHDALRAWSKIARQADPGVATPHALPGAYGEEPSGADVRLEAREIADKTPQAARAEGQLHRLVREGFAECACLMTGCATAHRGASCHHLSACTSSSTPSSRLTVVWKPSSWILPYDTS